MSPRRKFVTCPICSTTYGPPEFYPEGCPYCAMAPIPGSPAWPKPNAAVREALIHYGVAHRVRRNRWRNLTDAIQAQCPEMSETQVLQRARELAQ